MGTTRSHPFPYERDEFDVLVGTLDEDDLGEEDGATYGFFDKNYFYKKGFSEVLSFNFQGTDDTDIFYGGPNGDTLKGGKGIDMLHGGDGNDHIYGGADTDWLFGDGDDDHLFGEDGSDHLFGGAGNDVLVAGKGLDQLTGGSGYDRFQFAIPAAEDALFSEPDSYAGNPDQIKDFSSIDVDLIELHGWGIAPTPFQYVEGTIDFGAGYNAARTYAETLLNDDNSMQYAFVTDGVNGYLFIDAFKSNDEGPADGLYEGVEVGIVLVGLKEVYDFDFGDIVSII
jgi:Ca2+-binding RTX toxin-like protein